MYVFKDKMNMCRKVCKVSGYAASSVFLTSSQQFDDPQLKVLQLVNQSKTLCAPNAAERGDVM